MDLHLRDTVCLVTGSTAGIGLATARLLADEGAQVVTTGRHDDAPGVGEALHVAADLARAGEPERVVREAEQRLGRVDCLVNNVGVAFQRTFEEVTDEQWDELWQLNVMSYVRAIRAVLPGMKERGGGVIVNVSSTAGKRPSASMPRLLGDEVRGAVAVAADRRRLREGRDPLERGHAGADRHRRLARTTAGSPTSRRRAAGSRATRCSPRSAAAGRSGGWRSRRRSPPWSRSCARRARATSPAPRGAPTAEPCRSSSSATLSRCASSLEK